MFLCFCTAQFCLKGRNFRLITDIRKGEVEFLHAKGYCYWKKRKWRRRSANNRMPSQLDIIGENTLFLASVLHGRQTSNGKFWPPAWNAVERKFPDSGLNGLVNCLFAGI